MEQLKFFLSKEKPTIIQFSDGNYGIRRKRRFSGVYLYLDLDDILNSPFHKMWRTEKNVLEVIHRMTWIKRTSLQEVYSAYDLLNQETAKQKKKALHSEMEGRLLSEDEVEKSLCVDKLKGRTIVK